MKPARPARVPAKSIVIRKAGWERDRARWTMPAKAAVIAERGRILKASPQAKPARNQPERARAARVLGTGHNTSMAANWLPCLACRIKCFRRLVGILTDSVTGFARLRAIQRAQRNTVKRERNRRALAIALARFNHLAHTKAVSKSLMQSRTLCISPHMADWLEQQLGQVMIEPRLVGHPFWPRDG